VSSRGARFLVVGAAVALFSAAAFALAVRHGASPRAATSLRLLLALPLLHLGYARVVDRDLWRAERAAHGTLGAERLAAVRTFAAVALSSGVKWILEPVVAARVGAQPWVPLASDYLIGPALAWAGLALGRRASARGNVPC
jgi:hypothetical protein